MGAAQALQVGRRRTAFTRTPGARRPHLDRPGWGTGPRPSGLTVGPGFLWSGLRTRAGPAARGGARVEAFEIVQLRTRWDLFLVGFDKSRPE